MKKLPLLASTLIAAAALSICATPAWADSHELSDGGTQAGGSGSSSTDAYTFAGDTFEISSGTISSSSEWGTEGHLGAWIVWAGNVANNNGGTLGTSENNTTITGSGFLGLVVRAGQTSWTTSDLTNVNASAFTGQLCVVNTYAKNVTVQLKGDWSGTEYVFGGVTAEWANASGTGSTSVPYYRGYSDSTADADGHDTLALQDNTTLAGITGTSKGYTVSNVSINDNEAITVASDTTLTIAGTGTYSFYGTLATSDVRASLVMASTGSGKQTFGGTNYLQNVTVTAGTLALGGTTDISGDVTVASGSTLDLSGTITLGSAISNSGTVVVDSDVVFVLDNLTANGTTYTIISGEGSIDGWSNLDYSNFSISGTTLTSDRQITVGADGSITYNESGAAQNLTWNGSSSGDTWNSNVSSNTVWTNSSTGGNDYFVNGDSVTFTSTGEGTVTISGNVHAAEMAVSGSYTFANSENSTLTVDSVSVTGGVITVTLTGGEFTIGSYEQSSGTDTASAFVIGDNTTVTMDNFHAYWHQTTTLGTGAVWTVTTELWYSSNHTEVITGGTINAQQLTISNVATIAQFSNGNLNIGSGGLKNDTTGGGYFAFGDDLTVGVWGGTSDTNTSWSSNGVAIQFVGTGTGTTFYTEEGQSITLSGSLSGSGFTNTGEGTLILSGEVAFSNAIINSGTIAIDSNASFVLDNLTMGTEGGTSNDKNYYIVITGDNGTVSADDITISNFTGGNVYSSWNVWTDGLSQGYLVIYGDVAKDLTWNGTNGVWDYSDNNWSGSSTFSPGDNVIFDGSDSQKSITLGAAIEAGTITFNAGGYTITNGDGNSLKADSITVGTDARNTTTTIAVSTLEITGTIGIQTNGDSGSAGTPRVLVIGDGSNVTTATAGALYMQGDSELQIAKDSTLTVETVTDGGAFSETISGEGTFIVTDTFTHSNGHGFNISIANFEAVDFTISGGGSATFSGASSKITGTLLLGSSGDSLTYTGSGTHTVGTLEANTNQTVTLDFSGLTGEGSLTITKLDFGNSGTLEIKGNASGTGTITTVDFNRAETLAITGGIVKVGSLTDNDQGGHAATVTIAEGSILSVGSMEFATGQAANVCSSFSGTSDGAGTLIVDSITIGNDKTGAATEIKDVTFITGGVSFGTQSGSSFYLFLDNVEWGFTKDTTIAAATGGTSRIEIGDKTSGSLGTTTEATTTVINTNKYDTDSYTFTETGLTIEIAAVIAGSGTLAVTGNGSLTLSGANEFTGGTVIDAGKVIADNASALGTGDVTIENGGQLEINSDVTISNNITIILSEANISDSTSPTSLVVTLAAAGDTDVYALTGTGSIADGVTITITVDEAVAQLLASGGEYTFDIYDGVTVGSVTWVIDETTLAGYTWNDDGTITLRGIPEPELFSIFFGLGAIGLVATRRRRRVA